MTDWPAPFDGYRDRVRPEWIDHNGHMNMGYYMVAFDFATDEFLRFVGLDEAHRAEYQITTFCLEAHINYLREVRAGDALRFTTLLLAYDAKRIHYVHAMYHATEGYLAATNEVLSLHVNLATRRAAPMVAHVLDRLRHLEEAHAVLPRPPEVGHRIGLARA